MKKNRSTRIEVTAFDMQGNKVKAFSSIYMFRKFVRNKNRLDGVALKCLRKGKIIKRNGYLLGLTSKFNAHRISPFRCKSIVNKINAEKNKNIKKIKKLYRDNQLIAIIGKNLKLIGYTRKTIRDLARQEGIPVGTIKASLHRSTRKFSVSPYDTRYYVHLEDIPAFIRNVKKSM